MHLCILWMLMIGDFCANDPRMNSGVTISAIPTVFGILID
jgi:hypothetical protein